MTLIFFLKKKQNLKTFIIFFIIFSFFYFLFENLIASLYIFSTPLFSLFEKINIFFISLFDISILKNITIFILVILFIFSISLMFTFLLSLIKEIKKISSGKSL